MVHYKHLRVKPDIFDNPLLGFHLKGLRMFGLLIGTNQNYPLWHFLRSTFYAISYVVCTILIIIRVLRGIHILMADFILRPTTFMQISFFILGVNAYLQRERIVRLVNFIHEDLLYIRSRSDDLEDKILRKTMRFARRITILVFVPSLWNGFVSCLEGFVLTILYPSVVYIQVLSPQKLNGTAQPLLIFESFPVGEVVNNFILGYVGSYYFMILNCLTIPLLHSFGACLLKFIIFKIEILSKRLSEMDITKITPKILTKKDIDQLNENEKNLMRLKMCVYCVEEQMKIRWFVNELEQLFRIPLFMDFFIFSGLICLLLFTISTGLLSKLDYCFATVFISAMAVFQLLYHWQATILTKNHEALCTAIYSCDWYNYSPQIQKSIRLIMMDAEKPLIITAFIIELKLDTVLDIFRGAFSYFSFLKNFR